MRAWCAATLVGLLLTSAPASGQSVRPEPDSVQLVEAIRAAIGSWAHQQPIRPVLHQMPQFGAVRFYRGTVSGPHEERLVGLAAVLPDGRVLPARGVAVRRLLSPYVQLDVQDTAQLLAYAATIAQLDEGMMPGLIGAVVIRDPAASPDGVRQQLAAMGVAVAAPVVRAAPGGGIEVQFTLSAAGGAVLSEHRVELAPGSDRFADQVFPSRLILGY